MMKRKFARLAALAAVLAMAATLLTACGGGATSGGGGAVPSGNGKIKNGRYFLVKYPESEFFELKGSKLTWRELSMRNVSIRDDVIVGNDDEEEMQIPYEVYGDVLRLFFDYWYLREGGADNKPMNGRYVLRKPESRFNSRSDYTYLDFDSDTLTTYIDYYDKKATGKWTIKNGVLSVQGDDDWDKPCVVAGDLLFLVGEETEYVLEGSKTQIADTQS